MRWVVVGAGAAGCVVARRLADAGHAVTVVEAGGLVPNVASTFDAMAAPGALFPGPFIRGRGLGGSGAVNGMVMSIGDLDQYRRWGWDDVEDALARVRVPRAQGGEAGPVDRALLAAATDAEPARLAWRDGRRVTAADAYLAGAPVDVQASAEASSVDLHGDRATAVRLADGRAVAADAVAVCAGAIGSPQLLWAAGVDHPELGRGLRNHAGLPVTLRLRAGVDVDVHGPVTGAVLRRGDLEIVAMNHLGPRTPGHAMLLVTAMAPTGAGWLERGPVVHHDVSAHDHARLAAGLALARELLGHPAFATIVEEAIVGEAPAGVFHATSTCRMGSVVDGDGRVAGLANVHVVDASVFPDIPDSGTYLPTLVLAEHLAPRLASL